MGVGKEIFPPKTKQGISPLRGNAFELGPVFSKKM
jgi:hypothetical protein